jgi:hypothetical protein
LDLEDVANATDLVVAACRDFKFEAELKLDILINIFLFIYSLEMIDYRLHKTTRWMYFRFVAGSVVHASCKYQLRGMNEWWWWEMVKKAGNENWNISVPGSSKEEESSSRGGVVVSSFW